MDDAVVGEVRNGKRTTTQPYHARGGSEWEVKN